MPKTDYFYNKFPKIAKRWGIRPQTPFFASSGPLSLPPILLQEKMFSF